MATVMELKIEKKGALASCRKWVSDGIGGMQRVCPHPGVLRCLGVVDLLLERQERGIEHEKANVQQAKIEVTCLRPLPPALEEPLKDFAR